MRTWGFQKAGATNENNCLFSYAQVERMKTEEKPAPGAPDGRYTKCNFKFNNGSFKYAFGFWYPRKVQWKWDTNSCQLGVKRRDTEIGVNGAKRGNGQYFAPTTGTTKPPRQGELARGKFWIKVNDSTHKPLNRNEETDGNIPNYFKAELWNCGKAKKGWLTAGKWVVPSDADHLAQAGWGKNNSGPALPSGEYVATFEFDLGSDPASLLKSPNISSSPTGPKDDIPSNGYCPRIHGVIPGTCWSLRASYDGYWNRKLWTVHEQTSPIETSEYITVTHPQGTR